MPSRQAGHREPLAGAQDQFGPRAGAGEHRATVLRRMHGVVLPPEVERRAAGDPETTVPRTARSLRTSSGPGCTSGPPGRRGTMKSTTSPTQSVPRNLVTSTLVSGIYSCLVRTASHRTAKPVGGHQCRRVQVADDSVILDGPVTVRHNPPDGGALPRPDTAGPSASRLLEADDHASVTERHREAARLKGNSGAQPSMPVTEQLDRPRRSDQPLCVEVANRGTPHSGVQNGGYACGSPQRLDDAP